MLGLGGGDTYRAVVEELDTSPPKLAGGGNPQTPTFQKAKTQKLQLFESPEPRKKLSFTLSAAPIKSERERHCLDLSTLEVDSLTKIKLLHSAVTKQGGGGKKEKEGSSKPFKRALWLEVN